MTKQEATSRIASLLEEARRNLTEARQLAEEYGVLLTTHAGDIVAVGKTKDQWEDSGCSWTPPDGDDDDN